MNQADFDKSFSNAFEEKVPDFSEHISVAVVGKVSTGKSSLINAILQRDRGDVLAAVGAQSGVTTSVTAYRLDDHVLIVDCPGLGDVRKENSEETINFLSSIDLGIFVVTGSADESQKSNFLDLKKHAKKIVVILNKIDEWDDLEEEAYKTVVLQWQKILEVSKVFGTCTKGYDPKTRKNAPMDIRGVDEVRAEIFNFLENEGKDILFARHLKNRSDYANKIILAALMAVAGEAFIPGSAVYITATQAASITTLNYLYTGQVISQSSVLALLPTFAGQSIGMTTFLWVKSLMPPTGVLDLAAACIAVMITFAMLYAVKWVLANGYSLDDKTLLKEQFEYYKKAAKIIKDFTLSDLKNKDFFINAIKKLMAVVD